MSTAERSGTKAGGSVALKDPHGGLTAAGRAWFGRKQGAHLKPGVKKPQSDMTPAQMLRKGSWAVRFYGRKGALPPLKKPNGEPTRYALSAAAWGEPVPTTVAAARRIAAKGHQLLVAHAKASAAKTRGGKSAGGKAAGAKTRGGKSAGGKSTGAKSAGAKATRAEAAGATATRVKATRAEAAGPTATRVKATRSAAARSKA